MPGKAGVPAEDVSLLTPVFGGGVRPIISGDGRTKRYYLLLGVGGYPFSHKLGSIDAPGPKQRPKRVGAIGYMRAWCSGCWHVVTCAPVKPDVGLLLIDIAIPPFLSCRCNATPLFLTSPPSLSRHIHASSQLAVDTTIFTIQQLALVLLHISLVHIVVSVLEKILQSAGPSNLNRGFLPFRNLTLVRITVFHPCRPSSIGR
jgi:hypothetical protein